MPAKRLWYTLVHQESVRPIFLHYAFKSSQYMGVSFLIFLVKRNVAISTYICIFALKHVNIHKIFLACHLNYLNKQCVAMHPGMHQKSQ